MKKELTTEQLINRAAKKTAKSTAEEVIEQLRNRNMVKQELSYYRRVEILLYNYSNLKEAIVQKDEDIEDLEKYGLPETSGSVIIYSSAGGGVSKGERYTQLIEKYKMEKKETERDLKRIDNALDKIRDDKYFKIIELKYLNDKERIGTDEKLAEVMGKDQSTITRNRKRIINKLITILFPQSIREVI